MSIKYLEKGLIIILIRLTIIHFIRFMIYFFILTNFFFLFFFFYIESVLQHVLYMLFTLICTCAGSNTEVQCLSSIPVQHEAYYFRSPVLIMSLRLDLHRFHRSRIWSTYSRRLGQQATSAPSGVSVGHGGPHRRLHSWSTAASPCWWFPRHTLRPCPVAWWRPAFDRPGAGG